MLDFVTIMDTKTATATIAKAVTTSSSVRTSSSSLALPPELAADPARSSSNSSSSSSDICSPTTCTPPANKRALNDELKKKGWHTSMQSSPQGSPTSLREEFFRDLTRYGRPRSFTCILMSDDDLLDYQQDTSFAGLTHPLSRSGPPLMHHARSKSLETASSADAPPATSSSSMPDADYDDDHAEDDDDEEAAFAFVKSRYENVRSRRWNSCPSHLSPIHVVDEKHLKERRVRCESEVQKIYEERKDHIMELFQDSWILTTPLDDNNNPEECEEEKPTQCCC